MFCKFCGSEMPDASNVCPECGKAAKNGEGWKVAVIALCAVILGAALVVAVLFGTGKIGGSKEKKAEKEPTVATEPTEAVALQSNYEVDDETAKAKADAVVAVIGEQKLTNSELQLYYRSAVYNFLNEYYYYLSAVGMDTTVPLGQQTCGMDQTKTWEEYFLDQALESWKSYAVLVEMAKAENFEESEEDKTYLANLPTTIAEEATTYGYESVEAMLVDQGGAGATEAGLLSYRTVMYKAMQYFAVKYEGMTPTDEEIDAYFEEHKAEFEASGITKESGKIGNVRHLLIAVEGGTTDENGNTVYSDEEWATCLAEAERVYQLWKDGEATEDSFVALVGEHTDDPGSATTGGLYENVSIGSGYVEEFENWAADAARVPGDTGLVKTPYGYHIMYYVSGQDVWYVNTSSQMLNERFTEFFDSGVEQYPMTTEYDKIVLGALTLA